MMTALMEGSSSFRYGVQRCGEMGETLYTVAEDDDIKKPLKKLKLVDDIMMQLKMFLQRHTVASRLLHCMVVQSDPSPYK